MRDYNAGDKEGAAREEVASLAGSQNILRPDQDHLVDGFLGRILKEQDAISGAREV